MRYVTPLLRYLFECRCKRLRRLLSRYHFAYLRKHYPYQRYTWGWHKTSTELTSTVFGKDGEPEAIVTTLLLDGDIRHDVERIQPNNYHATH